MTVVAAVHDRRERLDKLRVEEADAWFEYGESCRTARIEQLDRYEQVEPWAWNRLQRRLELVRDRRAVIRRERVAA